MAVLTESTVKKLFAEGKIKEKEDFYIERKSIVTPSAITFLHDKNITLHFNPFKEVKNMEQQQKKTILQASSENNTVFETLFGAKLTEKPEIMTHLRGNLLVFKDHPRIAFRGAIDSLESEIIVFQLVAQKHKLTRLTEDLQEIITFIRKMIRCEVSGEAMGSFELQNLSEKELREHSHHPSQYYGMKHFLPSYQQGEIVAGLNKLRTKTREVEITAYKAFKDEFGSVSREDIILSLNRLSSLFWIMMFKYLTDKYK